MRCALDRSEPGRDAADAHPGCVEDLVDRGHLRDGGGWLTWSRYTLQI